MDNSNLTPTEQSSPLVSVNIGDLTQNSNSKPELISDERLTTLYTKILDNIQKDRTEISDVFEKFCDMVFNPNLNGDSSSASKEAVVNLLKLKADLSDKESKIADLMTRIKLRDPNPYHIGFNTKQNITVKSDKPLADKKKILKSIDRMIREKQENKHE